MRLYQQDCRNRKLRISTAPPKAKSREPAYSKVPSQNVVDRRGLKSASGKTKLGQGQDKLFI